MKRLLYWITCPLTFIIFAVATLLESMAGGCAECCHQWEGWCFEYKSKYGGMHYKGDGIWTSYKELP